jgi:hypothetical protein
MGTFIISIFKIIGAILLIVLALILFLLITPLAFLWKAVVSFLRPRRKVVDIASGTARFFVEIAASYDQLGNAVFGGFFNWLFIPSGVDYYPFGDKDETISEVLGWNDHNGTLTTFGFMLVYLLDKIDKEHCKKAMLSGIHKAERKLKSCIDYEVIF